MTRHVTKPPATAGKFRDPVCGMEYDLNQSVGTVVYRGTTYNFCSHECKMKFASNPASFLDTPEVA